MYCPNAGKPFSSVTVPAMTPPRASFMATPVICCRSASVIGDRALDEAAIALATGELPVADDDRAARQHDIAGTLDLAALVARVVDVHVVRRGRDGAAPLRVVDDEVGVRAHA